MKRIYFLLLMLISHHSIATHNRGGRIEAKQIAILTLEITIYTYTKTSSIQADRSSLDSVYFGDGLPPAVFQRVSFVDLPGDVRFNTYINTHHYVSAGTYKIHFSDPNRNHNVINIPISVNTAFSLETEVVLQPVGCPFFSPRLLSIPIFQAPVEKDFKLSRTAYDPNWDSLHYELDTCLGDGGMPVPGYTIPPGVSINPNTGEFKWEGQHIGMGEYNFALKISKWKNGVYRGYVLEDFQVTGFASGDTAYHFNTSAYPPDFTSHVLPGDTFVLPVEYLYNNIPDSVEFFSEIINQSLFNNTSGEFIWTPSSQDVRSTPYVLQFRGKEDFLYSIFVDGAAIDTCRPLVGIDELDFINSKIKVYPNPADNYLYISIDEITNKKILLEVFDLTCKAILRKEFSKFEVLSISEYKPGIYFLRFTMENNIIHRKIIIN